VDGTRLITYVRKVLRDVLSDYQKGEFWDDDEILLSLNAAQDVFLNNCLKLRQLHYLRWIIRRTDYETGSRPLPADYVYYVTAHVGDDDDLKLAELYLGGVAEIHRRARQRQALIVLDRIEYIRGRVQSGGRLYYYSRPTPIIADEFDASFDEEVYDTQIVNLASVMCAMKETSTS